MLTVTSARTIEAGKIIKLCFFFSLPVEQLSSTIFCALPFRLDSCSRPLFNRLFISCALSILALSESEAGVSIEIFYTSLKIKIMHLRMNGTEISIKTKSSPVCFVFLKIKT